MKERPGPEIRWWRLVPALALAVAGALLLAALVVGIRQRAFDPDEVEHAHAIWLISVGDRPFHDFFEVHPPFVWYLLVPLFRPLAESELMLPALRGIAAVGNLTALGLVAANVRVTRPRPSGVWVAAAALLVGSTLPNLNYFLEFRPDAWPTALLFGALLIFRLDRPRPLLRRYAVFAFLATASILASPKLVLLVVLFSAVDLWRHRRSPAPMGWALSGHALGIAGALAAAVAFLRVMSVDPVVAYRLTIEYHALFLRNSSFERGLLLGVLDQPLLLGFVLLGLGAWLALLRRGERGPERLEIAVLAFLVLQLALVGIPYKQYVVPWFVLALLFVPFTGMLLRRYSPRAATVGLLAVIFLAGAQAWGAASTFQRHTGAAQQMRVHALMDQVVSREGRIVTKLPYHPVTRRDVFYGWVRTLDPGGYDTERLMREMDFPPYSERFERPGYVDQLERHTPALVFLPPAGIPLPPGQRQVLDEYLASNSGAYHKVRIYGSSLWVHRAFATPALIRALEP